MTAAREPWGARHERRGPETARWGAPADAQRRSERLASRQRRGPGARDARGRNRPSHLSGAASRPHAVVTARPEPQGRRGDVRRRHRERHGRCTQPMAPTPGSVVRRGCQCSVETTCRTLMLRANEISTPLLPGSGSVSEGTGLVKRWSKSSGKMIQKSTHQRRFSATCSKSIDLKHQPPTPLDGARPKRQPFVSSIDHGRRTHR